MSINFIQKFAGRAASFALALALFAVSVPAQQPASATLRGQVTDEFGGVVIGATVTASDAAGVEKSAQTNNEGAFAIGGLVPGRYTVRVLAGGFASYENAEVEITPGRREPLNIQLSVSLESEEVNVAAESPLSLDESNRGDALVLKGKDLEALPEDPDELAAALQALAGPAAGPNGGQITIDGFEGGRIPPKDSIREVRINDNPMAAERDQPGFGGIQILTKPGTDKLRVSAYTSFADEALNSRNPFAAERVPYQMRRFGGNVSGTIVPKKSSFFVDVERNGTDDNDIINATVLNPTTFQPERFTLALLTPNRRVSFSPRVDYAINQSHTLVARYNYFKQEFDKLGLGSGFSLLSRAFDQSFAQHQLQLTETAILNPSTVNETRFQYIRGRNEQNGDNTVPALNVSDAFNGGGSQIGNSFSDNNRWEVTNITTVARGNHSIKFGGRLRGVNVADFSENNFGGTFTFNGGIGPELQYDAAGQIVRDSSGNPVILNPSIQLTSIERYRRTLLLSGTGLTAAQLVALGALPTQFTISGGNPEVDVRQTDFGGFVQDDWKLRPNLTIGGGVRYEAQSNISNKLNFAPRVYMSWAPDGGDGKVAKTVIRLGFGIFFDRFNENFTLQANRFNGENQLQFLVTDPTLLNSFPNVPSFDALAASSLPQVTRIVADDLREPYSYSGGLLMERQLPKKFMLNAGFITHRTKHVLRSRDLLADQTGTFDPRVPRAHLYQYESSGTQNMNQLQLGISNRLKPALSMFAFYTLMKVDNDTDGPGTFPADYTNLRQEYGRASFDTRHRFMMGASIGVPWAKLMLSPMLILNTGRPFNIITGQDTNGDGIFAERPSLVSDATCATRTNNGADIVCTPYGTFNLRPAPGTELIPRNYGEGPGFFSVNLGITRQWAFGSLPGSGASTAQAQPGGNNQRGGGGGGGGNRGGGAGQGGGPGGGAVVRGPGGPPGAVMMQGPGGFGGGEAKRYTLSLSVNIQNLLNHTNLGSPVGNLSSTFFGQSLQSFGGGFMFFGPGGGFGGGSAAAGNRRIQATLRFNF